MRGMVLIPIFTFCLHAQISITSELSQEKAVRSGETYTGAIVIHNDSKEQQEAKVYQTDYSFQFNGTNTYGEAGSLPRSNAKWIAFSPSYVTLPPEGSVSVNYIVTVPRDSAGGKLTGTYWSMMMVEGIHKGSAESSLPRKDQKAQMGIMQTIRYGIQISTSIEKTGEKKIKFLGTNLVTKKDGKRDLEIDIENTGEIAMLPDVYVELFNDRGVSLGQFPGSKYRIYPGTSVRQLIDVSKVAKGSYKAMVAVDAGGDNVFGEQYTLKFK
jgi:hypothetical protein